MPPPSPLVAMQIQLDERVPLPPRCHLSIRLGTRSGRQDFQGHRGAVMVPMRSQELLSPASKEDKQAAREGALEAFQSTAHVDLLQQVTEIAMDFSPYFEDRVQPPRDVFLQGVQLDGAPLRLRLQPTTGQEVGIVGKKRRIARIRQDIEEYLEKCGIEPKLQDAAAQVLYERPDDPFLALAKILLGIGGSGRGNGQTDQLPWHFKPSIATWLRRLLAPLEAHAVAEADTVPAHAMTRPSRKEAENFKHGARLSGSAVQRLQRKSFDGALKPLQARRPKSESSPMLEDLAGAMIPQPAIWDKLFRNRATLKGRRTYHGTLDAKTLQLCDGFALTFPKLARPSTAPAGGRRARSKETSIANATALDLAKARTAMQTPFVHSKDRSASCPSGTPPASELGGEQLGADMPPPSAGRHRRTGHCEGLCHTTPRTDMATQTSPKGSNAARTEAECHITAAPDVEVATQTLPCDPCEPHSQGLLRADAANEVATQTSPVGSKAGLLEAIYHTTAAADVATQTSPMGVKAGHLEALSPTTAATEGDRSLQSTYNSPSSRKRGHLDIGSPVGQLSARRHEGSPWHSESSPKTLPAIPAMPAEFCIGTPTLAPAKFSRPPAETAPLQLQLPHDCFTTTGAKGGDHRFCLGTEDVSTQSSPSLLGAASLRVANRCATGCELAMESPTARSAKFAGRLDKHIEARSMLEDMHRHPLQLLPSVGSWAFPHGMAESHASRLLDRWDDHRVASKTFGHPLRDPACRLAKSRSEGSLRSVRQPERCLLPSAGRWVVPPGDQGVGNSAGRRIQPADGNAVQDRLEAQERLRRSLEGLVDLESDDEGADHQAVLGPLTSCFARGSWAQTHSPGSRSKEACGPPSQEEPATEMAPSAEALRGGGGQADGEMAAAGSVDAECASSLCDNGDGHTEGHLHRRRERETARRRSVRLASMRPHPLHTAVTSGNAELLQDLLEEGIPPNRGDTLGIVPLHLAAEVGRLDLVDSLLQAGASPDATTSGDTPRTGGISSLHAAAWRGNNTIVNKLISAGAEPSKARGDGVTPLHFAAQEGHVRSILALLSAGAEVGAKGGGGFTPLHDAALFGRWRCCTLLISVGAAVDSTSDDGSTPLHLAARNGHLNAVHWLLVSGASRDLVSTGGFAPVHDAAYAGHADVVRRLLKGSHDPNKCSDCGSTPLHLAAQAGHTVVVKVLLDAGAAVAPKFNTNIKTPMQLAKQHGHEGIAEMLKNHRKQFKAVQKEIRAPLGKDRLHPMPGYPEFVVTRASSAGRRAPSDAMRSDVAEASGSTTGSRASSATGRNH